MKAAIWNYQKWIKQTDPQALIADFRDLLIASGFEVLREIEHHFQPYGYTCLFLIAESHLAIHTFPEEMTTYIELSSCNKEKHDRFVAGMTKLSDPRITGSESHRVEQRAQTVMNEAGRCTHTTPPKFEAER